MSRSCSYFQSEEWETALLEYIGGAWDAETFLERSPEVDDPERVVERLRGGSDGDAGGVTIESLLERNPAGVELDPDDVVERWESERDEEFPETCPHDAYGDAEYCAFHLPPERAEHDVSDRELKEAFVANLRKDESYRQFVGANFGDLDLRHETLSSDDNFPIDLRLATIDGTLSLEKAIVSQDLLMHGAEIGAASFKQTEFDGYVGFHGAVFRGDVDFSYVAFGKKAEFWDARFDGDASFYTTVFGDYAEFRRVEFGGDAEFSYARFGRDAEFWDAGFRGEATFHAGEFGGYAEFRRVEFDGDADFKYVEFGRDAEFWEAEFDDGATFYAAEFEGYAEFEDAVFERGPTFRYAEFDRDAEFWDTVFGGRIDCRDAVFDAAAEFERTTFEDGADFGDTEFYEAVFDRARTTRSQVALVDTVLHSGEIIEPETEPTFYDLSGATIGQVDLESDNDEYHLFEFFRLYDTSFDGFDFPGHRDALNPTWMIHQFGGEVNRPDTWAELESTYLKAKNGAEETGDSGASAEFFLKEMKYRRRGYLETILDGDESPGKRLWVTGKWGINWFYNLTCGYGERPFRTILFSGGLVALFAVAYQLLGIEITTANFLFYLTFSLQAFVTLILGGVPEVDSVVIRLLASFEAFLGAFFVALFVFALARSIRR